MTISMRRTFVPFSDESRVNIRAGIIDVARELSDTEYQRDVWVLASRPGVMGSLEEAMESLIDDYSVYEVLAEYGLFDLNADQATRLRQLADELYAFYKRFGQLRDCEAIQLPEWQRVVQLAKG